MTHTLDILPVVPQPTKAHSARVEHEHGLTTVVFYDATPPATPASEAEFTRRRRVACNTRTFCGRNGAAFAIDTRTIRQRNWIRATFPISRLTPGCG